MEVEPSDRPSDRGFRTENRFGNHREESKSINSAPAIAALPFHGDRHDRARFEEFDMSREPIDILRLQIRGDIALF